MACIRPPPELFLEPAALEGIAISSWSDFVVSGRVCQRSGGSGGCASPTPPHLTSAIERAWFFFLPSAPVRLEGGPRKRDDADVDGEGR
jgi:hypothetical protein